MIPLKLPSSHPNASVMQNWATDKENLLKSHGNQIVELQKIIRNLLTRNPDLKT